MHDSSTHLCAVCGEADRRKLDQLRLGNGQTVTVCGSDELVLKRVAKTPQSLTDLKKMVGDRRRSDERRIEGDELGEQLTAAFSRERRSSERRTPSARR